MDEHIIDYERVSELRKFAYHELGQGPRTEEQIRLAYFLKNQRLLAPYNALCLSFNLAFALVTLVQSGKIHKDTDLFYMRQ